MGTDNGGSIQCGYNFEILNTFEMGHLKKTCSHIPSRMDPSQTPGVGSLEEVSQISGTWLDMRHGGGGRQVAPPSGRLRSPYKEDDSHKLVSLFEPIIRTTSLPSRDKLLQRRATTKMTTMVTCKQCSKEVQHFALHI